MWNDFSFNWKITAVKEEALAVTKIPEKKKKKQQRQFCQACHVHV